MIDGCALTDTFDIRDNFLKEQFLELSKVIRVPLLAQVQSHLQG